MVDVIQKIDPGLELIISGFFRHITDEAIDKRFVVGIRVHVTPELRITVKEMMKKFHCTNQRDFLATLTPYALSKFQGEYNPGLKALKHSRTDGFFNGNFRQVVNKYGTCHHFFERIPGGRKDWNIYAEKETVISPISDNADYFNLSVSDMVQVMICGIVVDWEDLPEDARKYFEGINAEFAEYAKNFLLAT
jgi:hypothetical protein